MIFDNLSRTPDLRLLARLQACHALLEGAARGARDREGLLEPADLFFLEGAF